MKYPHFRYQSQPTPSDLLVVCDVCQDSAWTIDIDGEVNHCFGCHGRMRKGTEQERRRALDTLAAHQ